MDSEIIASEQAEGSQINAFTAANIQTSNIFELPPISPDPSYDDRGNTRMAWTEGLFGLVKFVEWSDFDKVWGEGMTFLSTISEQERANANSVINSVRMLVKSDEAEDERIRRPGRGVKRTRNVRRIWNNSASISGHARILIDAIGLLLRNSLGPHRDSYSLNIEKEASVSSEMITDEAGEKLHFSIPQNLKSDAAVVLGDLSINGRSERISIDKRVIKSLPLCHFELKGPTLELAGVKQAEKVRKEMQPTADEIEGEETGDDAPSTTEAGINIAEGVSSGTISGENGSHPTDDIVDSQGVEEGNTSTNTRKRPQPYTAKQVADTFNFLFSDSAFLDTRNPLGGPIRDTILRVSQAVVSAVFSYGGCAFLYNLESGIGFRVSKAESSELTVEVTGVLLSDGCPNNGSAMYAIAKHCIDRFLADREGSISEFRGRAIALGANSGRKEDLSTESSHEQYQPLNSYNSEQLGSSQGTDTEFSGARQSISTTTMENLPQGLDVGIDPEDFFARQHTCIARRGITCLRNRFVHAKKFKDTIERALMAMFLENEGIIGIGVSGVVLTGYLAQKKVAIKTAFDNCRCGSEMLQREIGIYNLLRKEGSALLGSVLPNMILGWNKPLLNSVYDGMIFLVTEYVGYPLYRDEYGNLWIGNRAGGFSELKAADEYLICSSALRGLRCMFENGVFHGDISLDNLRAERKVEKNGTVWKTWWIDLGLATNVSRHVPKREAKMFRADVLEVCSLFKNISCAKLATLYCASTSRELSEIENLAYISAQ